MKAYRYIRTSGVQIIQTDPNEATVVDFYVDPDDRGHGVGRRLMNATCKDADKEGVTLFLKPLPFGSYDIETETYHPPGLSYKQLCAFYRKFNFRFQAKPFQNVMKRLPKG